MGDILRQRIKAPFLSNCEKKFIVSALSEGRRIDGRHFEEFRNLDVTFGSEYGCCFVSLGETKVLAQVVCDLDEPRASRPNEGVIYINLEFGPMANPGSDTGRTTMLSTHVSRFLEKCLKDSNAIDLETLCIVSEEKVWVLRLMLIVLNHDGNLLTCCSIAALASLCHFKTPMITFEDDDIIVHSLAEKVPVNLSIHHYPIAISYAFFENNFIVLDPNDLEERVRDGELCFGLNSYREICSLHYGGKALLKTDVILKYANQAAFYVTEIVKKIKGLVEEDMAKRKELNGDVDGLVNIINTERVLAASQDRNSLRLTGDELEIIFGENYNQDSKKLNYEKPEPRSEEESSEEDEDGDEEVQVVKSPSAGDISYGSEWFPSGGENTWQKGEENDDEDDGKESDGDVQVVGTITDDDRIVEKIVLSGDSEEEETTTVKGEDL